ncbi:hypothetical protein GCM10010199_09370 [Dactylosporangium roseum]
MDRQLLRAAKVDVAQVAAQIPPDLMATDGPRGVPPRGHDRMRLTVAGIACCEGGREDLDLFFHALRWMAQHEARHYPEPGKTSVKVTRAMLAKALRIPARDAVRLRRLSVLLRDERWGSVGSWRSTDDQDWSVNVGRDVRYFRRVRSTDDFIAATTAWLEPVTVATPAADLPGAASPQSPAEHGSYVDERVFDLVRQSDGARWDCTKLLALLRELDDNYRAGNAYAAHALLRAVMDHIPPLFGETTFAPVANNHPWGKTDGRYMKRLVHFRDQADDVMHRQISRTPCVLTMEDMPARAAVNRFLLGCVSKLA